MEEAIIERVYQKYGGRVPKSLIEEYYCCTANSVAPDYLIADYIVKNGLCEKIEGDGDVVVCLDDVVKQNCGKLSMAGSVSYCEPIKQVVLADQSVVKFYHEK